MRRELLDDLRAAIVSGELPPGSRLPSGRVLARRYQLARNTVLAAIRDLQDEGLVVSRHGSGVFVAGGGDADPIVQQLRELRVAADTAQAAEAATTRITLSDPSSADPREDRPFVAGESGYHTFRIPSLIVTPKGTALAFCEGRREGRATDLVVRGRCREATGILAPGDPPPQGRCLYGGHDAPAERDTDSGYTYSTNGPVVSVRR